MSSTPSHPAVAPPEEPPAAGPPRSPADEHPPWPVWTAPAAVALGLVLGSFGTIIVDVIGSAGGSTVSNPSPATSIIADIVFDLCFVAAALWLARWRGGARPADFGFRRIRLSTGVGAVVAAAVAYYGLTALYSALVHLHGKDKLPSELGATHSTAALVAASLFVCAIAPMCEEFFFRGFVFGALRNIPLRVGRFDGGPWIAAVLTGILFGLAHTGSASSQYLIPLGFLGFVLCLVRWRTGSLYPCMALHSANNALALGVNQLNWSALAILGLIAASWLVIGVVTGPLSARAPQVA
ncbi:MAG TPA: type II CAAX endopeptidase family protein [Solirubrobacteraceae bacterium]|nr:type II CAAX endopeptidase family protein [Solirubrobacteraceae bacterium]